MAEVEFLRAGRTTVSSSNASSGKPWPREIRLKTAEKTLEIEFDDGRCFRYPAEFLRIESPSADVTGHSPNQRITVAGKRHVGIAGIDPVGNYAIRIRFDDGHDSGIYTWSHLHQLGDQQEQRWESYVDTLKERGLSRES